MKNYPTPHIKATPEDFGKTVLMPGDPLRSKYIAENYLDGAKLINDVRGIQGYTGLYGAIPVTVMASGMGMPSISIYAHELYNIFGVENIIRIGSMGGYSDDVKLMDVVLAMSASTDSNMQNVYGINGHIAPTVSYELLKIVKENADRLNIDCKIGSVLSSDNFYTPDLKNAEIWRNIGILGVEMETAALYMAAAECHKFAMSILTCTDHVFRGESLGADARKTALTEMINIALATAAALGE